MFEKIPHAEWNRNLALMMAGLVWDDARGEWVTSFWTRQEVRVAVASCLVCGGKYRPAGGECIHEHPATVAGPLFHEECGVCDRPWRPGHTCIRQPTEKEQRDMAEMAWFLRVLDEALEHFGYETQSAAPELYEGI